MISLYISQLSTLTHIQVNESYIAAKEAELGGGAQKVR